MKENKRTKESLALQEIFEISRSRNVDASTIKKKLERIKQILEEINV